MATRPTSLELRQYTPRKKELQGHADPTMLRLFRFLELVWDYTADKPFTEQTIYDLYCGKLPPRQRTEQAPPADLFTPVKAEFFARAQEKSNICNGPFKLDPEAVVKVIKNNLEFRSPCNVGAITDRLYVNVRMQHAVAVMRFIALEVVLGETGISYAKIADPLELCLDLFDRIVIYCDSPEAAILAARKVSRAFDETFFNPETPHMTKVLSRGISTGAEPRQVKVRRAGGVKLDGGKDESFGTKRAAIIYAARRECGGDQEGFFAIACAKLVQFNISPNRPHRNLPE